MIEHNLIYILREKAKEHHRKELEFEWSYFILNIRDVLMKEASNGKTRVNFHLDHEENITRAKEYLERFGFNVGTFSSKSGRGITINY